MQLGFVSAILADRTIEQAFEFAGREGFQCVELMCWPRGKAERKFAGVTHVDVSNTANIPVDAILSCGAHHGVEISGLGYYPNPLDPDPEVSRHCVEHLKKVIAGAEKLGIRQVNSFVGRDWTRTVDENWPRFLKVWKPLIRFAEDHGVRIGIENCPMSYSRDEWPGGKNLAISPSIWRRMFSDISSDYFGLNYDPSHMVWQRMDWLKPLREFQKKLFHIHAKDVLIQRDRLDEVGIFGYPKETHLPRIPGFGEINWAQFIGGLMEVDYDGPICIEVEDDSFGKTLAGRERALRVSRNVLKPFIST